MSSQPPFRAEFPGLDFVGRGPAPAAKEPFALDEFEAQVEDRDAARHDAGICGTTLPGVQHGDRTGWLRGERELREFGLPG